MDVIVAEARAIDTLHQRGGDRDMRWHELGRVFRRLHLALRDLDEILDEGAQE